MCKVIEEYRKAGRKIYVMAGAAHIDLSFYKPSSHFNNEPLKQAVLKLFDYLKTKKFAILKPKTAVLEI